MGKASRGKGEGSDRRARIAAQREAERRSEQRKRIFWAGGAVVVVAIVAIALVLVNLNSGSGKAAALPTGSALSTLTTDITTIPSSTTDSVGTGGVDKGVFVSAKTSAALSSAATKLGTFMATVSGTPLTSGGKPEVLYMGGEYCPYCAAERWALVNAFSRFGKFAGLQTDHSSGTDVYPNTPTFTFANTKYTSSYVDFTMVEWFGADSGTVLQNPTAAQKALANTYDPSGSIPFIDLGNKYAEVGNLAPLSPSMLANMSWTQVANAMKDPTSTVGKAEIGNANYLTAGICSMTGNKPATACTPVIQKLEADFAK